MRNLKKILALVLALMMVLSVMVTASAASPLEKYADKDSINPAYEQAVEVMTAAGVFSGNGTDFEPGRVLTRAEAATLITILDNGSTAGIVKCETNFDDVAATHWASGFITYCFDAGLIYGTSATTYEPTLELSYEQYAAMLLRVLGVDCTTTGKWYVPVRNNAVSKGLMKGIEGYTWTAGLTREAACQMTYNAMLADAETKTVVTGGYYTVTVGENTTEFASAAEAYFFAQGQAGETKPAVVYVPETKTPVKVTALLSAFDIKINTNATDPYGAPATKVEVNTSDDDAKNNVVLYYAEGEDFIYTAKTLATTIATEMKDYTFGGVKVQDKTVKGAWMSTGTATVVVDGGTGKYIGEAVALTDATLSEALAALTGDNTVVRVYTNSKKVITNIVVTNTVVDVVTKVEKANAEKEEKAYIVLDKGGKVETEGYIVGEVVTYTLCGSTVENLAKADYIMGTLTSYNSKTQSYTINGTAYTLYGFELSAETVADMFENAYVFYTGANNTIISVAEELPSADAPSTPVAPTVPTDYAIIDAVAAKVVTGTVAGDLWTNDVQVVTDVLVQVKAYTTDGTYGVYDLEVTKAAADIKNAAGKVLVAKDAWYIVVGGTYHTLNIVEADKVTADTDKTLAGEIGKILQGAKTKLVRAVYPYSVEDGVITLYPMLNTVDGTETKSGVAIRMLSDYATISASSMTVTNSSGKDILINADTTYLLKYDPDATKANDEYFANTTALAGTVISGDDVVVIANVAVTKDKDGNVTDRVYTAKYVFAYGDTYNAGEAPEVPVGTEMVYVDASDYTLTEMSKDGNTYIYNVVKTDGTTAQLKYVGASALADDASGIYLLKTDGSLGTKVAGQTAAKVEAISGTTVKLDSTYKTINDSTTVVGEIEVGAEVLYILAKDANGKDTNQVSLVFVTKAAQ